MDAIWRTGPVESLHFVMDCRLFGAKKFPEPAVMYCPLGMKKQMSVKFLSIQKSCLSRKSLGKRRRQNVSFFVMEGLSVSSEASHLIANLNNLTKKNTSRLFSQSNIDAIDVKVVLSNRAFTDITVRLRG